MVRLKADTTHLEMVRLKADTTHIWKPLWRHQALMRFSPQRPWHSNCSASRSMGGEHMAGKTVAKRLRFAALAAGVGGALLFLWSIRAAGASAIDPVAAKVKMLSPVVR